MSVFSGKCDLADYIAGTGGRFDKAGNPVKIGDNNVSCYYSDEWLDFIAFKKKTGGVLYQHENVKVNSWNKDDIKKHCKSFDYKEVSVQVNDKRYNNGIREKTSYIYTYYDKEYTEKELNARGGVFITTEIHFETLLELIKYYPYLVNIASGDGDTITVFISKRSFVDTEFEDLAKSGYVSPMRDYYNKRLAEHYNEVALKYYNPIGHEIVEEIEFDEAGIGYTSKPVCERFSVSWDSDWLAAKEGGPSYWTSPKLISGNKIEISKQDLEHYIGGVAKIKYVEDFPVCLSLS